MLLRPTLVREMKVPWVTIARECMNIVTRLKLQPTADSSHIIVG